MSNHVSTPVENYAFLNGIDGVYADQEVLASRGDSFWIINNSPLSDYARKSRMLGSFTGLTTLIGEQLADDDNAVGLDIAAGSTPQALLDLLDANTLRHALATNYDDRRPPGIRQDPRLDHVQGGITLASTWQKIANWQTQNAPDGFSLVMHRPVGGLQYLPTEAYRGAAHLILSMVKPGGLFFTQIPRRFERGSEDQIGICQEIKARPGVTKIIPSPYNSPAYGDDVDQFVVIIK